LAGIADLRGSNRERAAIERQRAMLRAPVTRALADRDSLAGAMDRIASLRSTIDGAPVWSRVVASLAAELPADAFLTSLHASADTLRLEGSAPRAAAVFQALRADPAVRSLHPQGPIRQTVSEDGSTSEGFTLVAVTGRVP
ncbi:MAG TPA: PilN domain-containing protein, partial [Gemmatimonadaceae bacterium]|nr:PilN domain-containing protein [Gemmatimonadaceae bacterium]